MRGPIILLSAIDIAPIFFMLFITPYYQQTNMVMTNI